MFDYLSREEMLAVIGTPDSTWLGQRDHVLFLLMYNTGARVSEIIGVKVADVILDDQVACIICTARGGNSAVRCPGNSGHARLKLPYVFSSNLVRRLQVADSRAAFGGVGGYRRFQCALGCKPPPRRW
jgi:site-specific recombinase XerC